MFEAARIIPGIRSRKVEFACVVVYIKICIWLTAGKLHQQRHFPRAKSRHAHARRNGLAESIIKPKREGGEGGGGRKGEDLPLHMQPLQIAKFFQMWAATYGLR